MTSRGDHPQTLAYSSTYALFGHGISGCQRACFLFKNTAAHSKSPSQPTSVVAQRASLFIIAKRSKHSGSVFMNHIAAYLGSTRI